MRLTLLAVAVLSGCSSTDFRGSFVEAHFFDGPTMLLMTRGARRNDTWRMDLVDLATGPAPTSKLIAAGQHEGGAVHVTGSNGLRRSNGAHTKYQAIEPEWTDARFGIDPCLHDAVRFSDPDSYVLVREVTQGDVKHADVIRLSPDGKPLWTTRLPWGEVQAARLARQKLIVVLAVPEQAAFALDAADGHLLWRYEL